MKKYITDVEVKQFLLQKFRFSQKALKDIEGIRFPTPGLE